MLEQVCMFCGRVYGHKPGNGVVGTSHGVCPVCEPNALELLESGVGAGVSVPLSAQGMEVACA